MIFIFGLLESEGEKERTLKDATSGRGVENYRPLKRPM